MNIKQSRKTVERRRRSRFANIVRVGVFSLLSILVLLVVLIGFFVYWLIIRPLPQTSGNLKIDGLTGQVTVTRDKWGVPHISATNESDLFIAQGYVTAQDRLWQLDFNRRIGEGRLSEVLGNAALDQDKFLRTIGLRRAAEAELASMTAEQKNILESYAKGINDFINTHKDNLPIEFTLLGYVPEQWVPLDSITWGKVMAYDLGGNYDNEILRAALTDKFGAEQANQLMSLSPGVGTPMVVPPGVSYKGMDAALALVNLQSQTQYLTGDFMGLGSNNWVVSGAKTTTGKPMLANDPHLGVQNPSIWYEVELEAPGWHVGGVTFPGVPGVVVGHNDRIAWGVTNATGDTQDLYMEKTNPANQNQYQVQGQWQDMQIIPEEIKIKGQPSQTINVRITRHGPIMNDVISSLKNQQPMALKWVALGNTPLLGAVMDYDRAQNWQQFRDALKQFNIAGQNFVYADIDGNIGYQLTGLWPIRAKGDGLLPVPGWTNDYEWTGFIPFEDLPTAYNPPANFIATANNQQAPSSATFYIGKEFDPGWRAERITQRLTDKSKLSLQDLGNIQTDVFTIPGKQIAGYLGNLSSSDSDVAAAIKQLHDWDGNLTTDSVGGAIYEVTYQYMLENMFKAKLGDSYDDYLDGQYHLNFITKILDDPQNVWWGEKGRDALMLQSLQQAVASLKSQFGNNMADWQWGKLHTVSFTQTPIGNAVPGPLKSILNLKTVARAGDGTTVAAAHYLFSKPYSVTSGVSFRQLLDLSNLDGSQIVNTVGESGQPFSKHYGDDIDDWNSGKYHSFLFSDDAVNQQKEDVLTLSPS